MNKLTYSQQLAHPLWQQKRLRCLELNGWKCQRCQSGETTLHVHHRRYVRGRMAWEYDEATELQSLCEFCHAAAHHEREVLLEALLLVSLIHEDELAALVLGYVDGKAGVTDLVDIECDELSDAKFRHIVAFKAGRNAGESYPALKKDYDAFKAQCDAEYAEALALTDAELAADGDHA